MKILEIVLFYDRINQKLEALRRVWPHLEKYASSSFYSVFGCRVEGLTDEQKKWLQELAVAHEIVNFCCKERGRNARR